jgi:glyoxylase-like metal-dependent hydrolase (beta-lactamase superfamily II)
VSADVDLYVLDAGQIEILDWSQYDPAAAKNTRHVLSDPAFLVVHPSGTLLWDTGLDDSLAARREPLIFNDHAVFTVSNSLAGQLEQVGHPAASIDYLALSHFHPDHVGNVGLFPGATLLVQRDEYDTAFGPQAHKHYDPPGYAALQHNRVIALDGDHDVFGDGTVVIYRTAGHTVGGQSLLVDLKHHGPVLISGDLAHSLENWRARAIPPINHDIGESARSLARMHALVAQRDAQVWVQHDARQLSGLRKAPAVHR